MALIDLFRHPLPVATLVAFGNVIAMSGDFLAARSTGSRLDEDGAGTHRATG